MTLITLTNHYIDPVIWEDEDLCDFTINDQTDVWQINISPNSANLNSFLNVLNHEEISRAEKYYMESDRDRFIISRAALRFILSKYLNAHPSAIQFKLSEYNKPFVAHPAVPALHFNLSDTVGKVIIAIARSPIGIDVEFIKPDFTFQDILTNNFSIQEAEYINEKDSEERFFLLWTRKEAILKATGIGLTEHLKLIPSLNGQHLIDGSLLFTKNNWQLNSFKSVGNYMITIASIMPFNKKKFWNF